VYDFHKSIGNWPTNIRYIESKFNWSEIFIEKLLGATSSIPTLLPQHLFLLIIWIWGLTRKLVLKKLWL